MRPSMNLTSLYPETPRFGGDVRFFLVNADYPLGRGRRLRLARSQEARAYVTFALSPQHLEASWTQSESRDQAFQRTFTSR